jgi:DNA-binding transcriptional ArsR family regulator
MAIRVRITDSATDRVTVTVSPLLEALWSLHVWREPGHHPLNHAWVRSMRDLPASLRRDVTRFTALFQLRDIPGVPLVRGEQAAFEEELAVLRGLSSEQLYHLAMRPHYLDDGPKLLTASGSLTRTAIEALRQRGERAPGSRQVIDLLLTDPVAALNAYCNVLERYWRLLFRKTWERSAQGRESAIAQARSKLRRGVYAFLADLWPEVRVDQGRTSFELRRAHEHEIDLSRSTIPLVVMPSYFAWPHCGLYCSTPERLLLVFPPPGMVERVAPVRPSKQLLDVAEMLADETRLTALRYLVSQPRSTQELAALVHVGAPTLSEHLQKMERAGVLRSRREGYYVLYELNVDLPRTVASMLAEYLSPEHDIPDAAHGDDI